MDMAACREGRARVDDRRPRASAPCTGGARLGLAQPCGLCAARPGTVAMSQPPRMSPCHPPLSWSPHHATNCYFKYGNMGHIRHPIFVRFPASSMPEKDKRVYVHVHAAHVSCAIVSQWGPVSDLGLRLRRYRVGSGNRISDIGRRGTLCKFQIPERPHSAQRPKKRAMNLTNMSLSHSRQIRRN